MEREVEKKVGKKEKLKERLHGFYTSLGEKLIRAEIHGSTDASGHLRRTAGDKKDEVKARTERLERAGVNESTYCSSTGNAEMYVTGETPESRSFHELPDKVGRSNADTVKLIKNIGIAAAAFALAGARLYRYAAPMGIAFLCSAREGLPYLTVGLLARAVLLGGDPVLEITVTVLILVMRLAAWYSAGGGERKMFCEPVSVRTAISLTGGLVYGIVKPIAGGFLKADLLAAGVLAVSAPLFVVLFDGVTDKKYKTSLRYDIGQIGMAAGITVGLSEISLGGLDPQIIWLTFTALAAGASGGALSGSITGMACGLTCGITASPVFGAMGFIAGAVQGGSSVLPMLAACGTGAVLAFSANGFEALGGMIPNIFWGAAVYTPIARMKLLPSRVPFSTQNKVHSGLPVGAVSALLREENREKRIIALSDAMSSLASVFHAMSEKLSKPDISEVRDICESLLTKHCEKCPMSSVCRGREYERTADMINKLAAAVAAEENGNRAHIPGSLFKLCPKIPDVISEVTPEYARRLEKAAKEDSTAIFALDYEAMAKLLRSAAETESEKYRVSPELSQKIMTAACEMGMSLDTAAVVGTDKKTVFCGGNIHGIACSGTEINRKFSETVGTPLSNPVFTVNGEYVTFTLTSVPTISCDASCAEMRKENEQISGDSSVSFSCDGKFYSLISDGMGSGREAALTSKVTVLFLQKMLESGNSKNIVLEMLSNFIRHKNLECFATVDLLEINTVTREACFVKAGAASSFVLRGEKLFRIASSSLPIGITREITAEEISFSLLPGDTVIMISDGISQSFEDGFWLAELISSRLTQNLDVRGIASLILDEAKKNNSRSDDMTVNVIKIEEG